MKKSFIFFSLLIVFSFQIKAQWFIQPSGTDKNLNEVVFIDKNTGWIVGSGSTPISGTILKTTDGGANWRIQCDVPGTILQTIFFINEDIGWTAGWENGTILKSIDGGEVWNSQSVNPSFYFMSIYFIDELTGWVAGDNGIMRTTDGGLNWSGTPGTYRYCVKFADHNTGWTVGMGGLLQKSTDGGINWFNQTSGTGNNLNYIFCKNADTLWIAGGNGTILFTSDGGDNWEQQQSKTSAWLESIYFSNDSTGWATGYAGTILLTTDKGKNWHLQPNGTINNTLYSIFFTDENNGIIVGSNGTILRTTTGGILSLVESSDDIPSEFFIFQNYPNPFNPSTTIKYIIPQTRRITLSIYDLLGREVIKLLDEEKPAGEYETKWNASSHPSGVYFIKMQSGKFSEMRKIVLMK